MILCQITSAASSDPDAVPLSLGDLSEGRLTKPGFIRPRRLFTAVKHLVLYRAGRLRTDKMATVVAKMTEILTR